MFVSGLRLDAALPVNVIVSDALSPNVVLPFTFKFAVNVVLPVTAKSPPIDASSLTAKSSVDTKCSA